MGTHRKHYGLDNPVIVKDQHPRPERRVIPRHVIRIMMNKESEASTTSPRIRCTRCSDRLIQKFMVRIQGGWNKEDPWVCRLCYNKRNDIKVVGR